MPRPNEQARRYLESKERSGEFVRGPGVELSFAGTYENQLHARRTLALILPVALFVIFIIIYFHFRSVMTTMLVFTSVFVCWAGGLVFIWMYSQPWFLDVSIFGTNLRDLFQVHTINMSVAVWVGFLALFGIATDDAVVICTHLSQRFREVQPANVDEVRAATIFAGTRRIRPLLMTTATTVLALLPILMSMGRGADLMIPMSLPVFGGMVFEVITLFVAPVLYCWIHELKVARRAMSAWPH